MTCTNWLLTVLAVVLLAVTFWPNVVGASVVKWVVVAVAVIVIIVAWTMVECKPCRLAGEQKKGRRR